MKALAIVAVVGVLSVGLGGCPGNEYGYRDNSRFSKVRDPDNAWRGRGSVDSRKLYDQMDASSKLGGPKAE